MEFACSLNTALAPLSSSSLPPTHLTPSSSALPSILLVESSSSSLLPSFTSAPSTKGQLDALGPSTEGQLDASGSSTDGLLNTLAPPSEGLTDSLAPGVCLHFFLGGQVGAQILWWHF
ncbi:hypothetical protein AMECASPLE_035742 [Ameca splendens]|uniref:Uncharacterized protein n=1 Tax=Ameca splendens TaxID=208324 RepID=A0ABV0XWM6_9TELE